MRKPKPVRYEKETPGELVHVDIKKLGKVPDGGGWRVHGLNSAQARRAGAATDRAARLGASPSRGYVFLHHAVDDCTRLAYSEQLADERKETAAAFWGRARSFFAEHGITVTAVMTDNGSCYRSHAFADALGTGVKHRRTRPYRPQTNGKVERFNRTLATEWAYAQPYLSDDHRSATYDDWLHRYNHHRPHRARSWTASSTTPSGSRPARSTCANTPPRPAELGPVSVAPTGVALTGNTGGPESEYRLALNRNNQWRSRLQILNQIAHRRKKPARPIDFGDQ